jgi:hypothetical protein
VPTELVVLPKDSRPMALDRSEIEPVEAVETQRESSGHAPIAGVGDVEGDGDSLRKEGCALSSGVAAMIANVVWFEVDYAVPDPLLSVPRSRQALCYKDCVMKEWNGLCPAAASASYY